MPSQTFTANGSFPVPENAIVTSIECIGPGGGGGGAQTLAFTAGQGGGGGGGAYARTDFPDAIPGETLTVTVPAGGAAGSSSPSNGGSPGPTQVTNSIADVLCRAAAGVGGSGSSGGNGSGGAGGQASNSIGNITRNGGNGANGDSDGGGGGGGAGTDNPGGNASAAVAGTGGATGGGNGGAGGASNNGSAGSVNGGGGGGADSQGTTGGRTGGTGARGQVIITWVLGIMPPAASLTLTPQDAVVTVGGSPVAQPTTRALTLTPRTVEIGIESAFLPPSPLVFEGLTQNNTGSASSVNTDSVNPDTDTAVMLFVYNTRGTEPVAPPTISGLSLTWHRLESNVTHVPFLFGDYSHVHAFVAFTGASSPSGAITINFNGETQTSIHWAAVQISGADNTIDNFNPQRSINEEIVFVFASRLRVGNYVHQEFHENFQSVDNGVLCVTISDFYDLSFNVGEGYTKIYDTAHSDGRENLGVQYKPTIDMTPNVSFSDNAQSFIWSFEIAALNAKPLRISRYD